MRRLRKFLFEKKHGNILRCFSCGHPLEDCEAPCPKCGGSETRTCEVCGESLVKDYVYCPNCGVHLPCPICGAELDGQKCSSCGANFDRRRLWNPLMGPIILDEGLPYLHRICPRCTGIRGLFPSRHGRFCHTCGMKTIRLRCRTNI